MRNLIAHFLRNLYLRFENRPKSADTHYSWWEEINPNDLAPLTWYVNGEIVEA